MFIFEKNDLSDYFDIESEDLSITTLLNKYDIPIKNSFLYNLNDDYRALIEYIGKLYVDNKTIPDDIVEQLTTNLNFKAFLLIISKDNMHNILSDINTVIFKEIVTTVNLLSFGKDFKIFESYNSYNLENLGKLFREYEKKLATLQKSNTTDFIITFKHYTTLVEITNELCTINSTDVIRKKTINPLIDTLSETINLVKFNVKLDEEKINILNNMLGKLLFYYSHIPFINTINKDAQYLIDEFKFNFEKLADGYQLSKDTEFGGDSNHENYYTIFLNSSTTIICTLLYKLEITYNYEEYNDIHKFKEITELYSKIIEHTKVPEFENIAELKKHLLNNYTYIYAKEISKKNHKYIIEDFTTTSSFDSSNMYIIQSLILFNSDISKDLLLKVLKFLVSLEKFKNDYHEFFKLNLIDIIFTKFIYLKNFTIPKEIIDDVINYTEKNKIASHLLSSYTKIYLSLSLYYSFFNDHKSIEYSKQYYFNYIGINGKDLLDNEYYQINKDILYNHGKFYIDYIELENTDITNSQYIKIGKDLLEKYFGRYDINLKYKINQKLSNIITDIFVNDNLDNDQLNSHIENFISKDIFYGLTFVSIEGLCEKECQLIDIGYEKIEIPLFDEYKLRMAYSNVYKEIFDAIYEKNKEYIKQNIINLVISYIKSTAIYKDSITKLYNINKLVVDLLNKDNDEFVFVELYIRNLSTLNKKYSYKKTNKLFEEYAQNINNITDTYRLTGPKLGFILKKEDHYKDIIKKIEELKIKYNEDIINFDLTFAVSWGNKDNILDKSNHSIALALNSESNYNEFK